MCDLANILSIHSKEMRIYTSDDMRCITKVGIWGVIICIQEFPFSCVLRERSVSINFCYVINGVEREGPYKRASV